MSVESENHECIVISLAGVLDYAGAGGLQAELLERVHEPCHLLLDLQQVTFLDSHCLGVFVAVRQRLRTWKGSIGILCGNPAVRQVFAITRLDLLIPFYASREAFLLGLAPPAIG